MIPPIWLWSTRRVLINQVVRFRELFAAIARSVRQHLADAAGEACHAVCEALLSGETRPLHNSRPRWSEGPYEDPWRDDLEDDTWHGSTRNETPSSKPRSRWLAALQASLEAAVLWLRRQPSCCPTFTAVGLAAAAGAAVYAGGPLVAAGVTLLGAAYGLIRQADGAAADAGHFAETIER